VRTIQELRAEIEIRKALGLPRIELTQEERIAAFGDPALARCNRDPYEYERHLVQRLKDGLPMSIHDKRRARRFMKENA
jgi:hypothetical protein